MKLQERNVRTPSLFLSLSRDIFLCRLYIHTHPSSSTRAQARYRFPFVPSSKAYLLLLSPPYVTYNKFPRTLVCDRRLRASRSLRLPPSHILRESTGLKERGCDFGGEKNSFEARKDDSPVEGVYTRRSSRKCAPDPKYSLGLFISHFACVMPGRSFPDDKGDERKRKS